MLASLSPISGDLLLSTSSTVTVVADGDSVTDLSLNFSVSMFSSVSVPSSPLTVQVPLAFRFQVYWLALPMKIAVSAPALIRSATSKA